MQSSLILNDNGKLLLCVGTLSSTGWRGQPCSRCTFLISPCALLIRVDVSHQMAKNQDYLEEGKSQTTAPACSPKWPVRSALLTHLLVYDSDSSSFNAVDKATVYKKTLQLCNPVSCLIIPLKNWIQYPQITKSDKSSWSESPGKPDITLSFVIVLVDIINQQSVLKKRKTWLPSFRKAVALLPRKTQIIAWSERRLEAEWQCALSFQHQGFTRGHSIEETKVLAKLQTACSVHIMYNDVRLSL